MSYYIQISIWMIGLFGWNSTPLELKQNYSDGSTIYVMPISYVDSMGLRGWVDSSRSYPILTTRNDERVNIVQLNPTDFK